MMKEGKYQPLPEEVKKAEDTATGFEWYLSLKRERYLRETKEIPENVISLGPANWVEVTENGEARLFWLDDDETKSFSERKHYVQEGAFIGKTKYSRKELEEELTKEEQKLKRLMGQETERLLEWRKSRDELESQRKSNSRDHRLAKLSKIVKFGESALEYIRMRIKKLQDFRDKRLPLVKE